MPALIDRGASAVTSSVDAPKEGVNPPKHVGVIDGRKHQGSSFEERFWSRVDASGDCWAWLGPKNALGYGRMARYAGIGRNPITVYAHRFAYETLVGSVPDGMVIDHLCRNPVCCNPDHLQVVTPRLNVLRGVGPVAKNAVKTHCPKGHPYDEQNTFVAGGRGGRFMRRCRTCFNAYKRRWANAKRVRKEAPIQTAA